MEDDALAARFEQAVRTVRAAGALALDYFKRRDSLTVERKGRQDLVSVADRAVEDLIRREIGRAFPDDTFLGEEGGGGDGPRVWVIDPIDGTHNFLRGVPCWAVVLAFVADGRVEIGLTYDPVHDELFTARRGQGARRNGEPIRVSAADDPTDASVGLTFGFKMDPELYLRTMRALIEAGCEHRRMGSTAIMLCWVADGRLDGYITPRCSSWDALAGLVLVEEAGGLATDFPRRHGLTNAGGALACAPGLRPLVEAASGQTF